MHVLFRRSRHVAGLLSLASALTLLTSCSGRAATSGDIGIGVALDPKRAGMQSIYNGVQLAVEQLNAQNRSGAHFAMVKGPPEVSEPTKIATSLRDNPSVVGVVGHPESGITLNMIGEYADTKNAGRNAVVLVTPTGTSPAISGANPWLFRLCASDLKTAIVAARFALDSLHAKRASVIYRNDSYGKDWSKAFGQTYRSGGGQVVQRDPYLQNATQWDAYAGYLKMLSPDVLLFPGSTEDGLLALRAMRSAGVSVPFIGGDATSGLEANAAEFPNVRYAAFFLARRATSPEARAFIAAYTSEFKTEPDQRAALAYDATMLIARAAMEVGPDRAKIRDWIEGVGPKHPALPGVAAPIAFDAKHDAVNAQVLIAQVAR